MTPVTCFTADCWQVMDGIWHLQKLSPKPSGPQQHWAVAPASLTKDNQSTSWHLLLESSLLEHSQKTPSLQSRPHMAETLIFYSSYPWASLPAAPAEVTLLPVRCGPHIINTLQWQDSLSLFISPHLSFPLLSASLPFLSSLFSPWWYPCHVVMATIGALIAWLPGNWHHL